MKKNIDDLSREFLKERLKDPSYQKHHREEQMRIYVGNSIAALRKKKKMSPDEFAKKIGVKPTILTRIEKGEYGRYTTKFLLEVAQATETYLHIDFSSTP